jgi:hypothetical protein
MARLFVEGWEEANRSSRFEQAEGQSQPIGADSRENPVALFTRGADETSGLRSMLVLESTPVAAESE